MDDITVTNVRRQNKGRMAAKFDFTINGLTVRDCVLWNNDEGRPANVVGPSVYNRGEWVYQATLSRQLSCQLINMVVPLIPAMPPPLLKPSPNPALMMAARDQALRNPNASTDNAYRPVAIKKTIKELRTASW